MGNYKGDGDYVVGLKKRTKNRPHIDYEVPQLDDREDKPWHRVNASFSTVPSPCILLVLGFYLLVAFLTQLVEDGMPTPLRETDISVEDSRSFSEESALKYLHTIMGTKPRVAGTEYHLNQTIVLKDLLDDIARNSRLPITTDWQIASGDYKLVLTASMLNIYTNVSNIVALVEGESGVLPNGDLGTTLLLNCHYDSVPFALGASDNVVFCAVMAETLKRVSRRTQKFKHNILFLFNGAEENPLQGSPAFLQHPWAKNITAVINLDAAGMNGKANLFQVTDRRLLRAYASATNRPSAQSMGEFLFASGIVPSDTDFRIWRDFGEIYGVDIAFVKWGNVYHTRNDHPDHLRPGVLQCAGDMFLGLVNIVADMPELAYKADPGTAVYYDFLNAFLISYSLTVSFVVDALIAVVALLSVWYYVWIVGMRRSTVMGLLVAVGGRLLAIAAGVVLTFVCIFIMIGTTTQLRYLSHQWIVVPLFWMPFVIGKFTASQLYDAWTSGKSGLNRSLRALQAAAATRFLLSVVVIIMTCIPAFSTIRYVVSVPLLLMSATGAVSLALVRYVRIPAWQQLIAELLLSLPATMFVFTLVLRVDALMLPVMGRSMSNTPDLTVGLLNVGLAVLLTSIVSGVELLFSRRRLWAAAAALGAAALVLMFIPFAPFDAQTTALQRHYWFHTEIVSYTEDPPSRTAGVHVTKQERYTAPRVLAALAAARLNYSVRTDFSQDCDSQVYCNLPLHRTRYTESFSEGLFINMPGPAPFATPPTLRLTNKVCLGINCTLYFAMNGPAHNSLTFWPRANASLVAWSLSPPVAESFRLRARPVYAVVESTATYQEVFGDVEFWLTFQVPVSLQSAPIVDVSHHAHKKQHPEEFTREYQELLAAMPDYFNIDSSITIRSNYAF